MWLCLVFGREVTTISPQQLLRVEAEQILEHQMDVREHYMSDTLLRAILLGDRKNVSLGHGCCSRSPFHSCSPGVLHNLFFVSEQRCTSAYCGAFVLWITKWYRNTEGQFRVPVLIE